MKNEEGKKKVGQMTATAGFNATLMSLISFGLTSHLVDCYITINVVFHFQFSRCTLALW